MFMFTIGLAECVSSAFQWNVEQGPLKDRKGVRALYWSGGGETRAEAMYGDDLSYSLSSETDTTENTTFLTPWVGSKTTMVSIFFSVEVE